MTSQPSPGQYRRRDLRQTLNRDMRRVRSRQSAHRSFWRSLNVLGSVGWPVVLLMVGGAWVGHWLDQQWGTGVRLTLMLVLAGAILGGAVAWSVIQGTGK